MQFVIGKGDDGEAAYQLFKILGGVSGVGVELVSQLKDTLPDLLFDKLNGSLSIDQDRLKCHLHLIRSAAQDGAPRAAQLNAKKFCS